MAAWQCREGIAPASELTGALGWSIEAAGEGARLPSLFSLLTCLNERVHSVGQAIAALAMSGR